jgi:hypothetical protein
LLSLYNCSKIYLWGEILQGEILLASCPWSEMSLGQVVYEASWPCGQLSMG